MQPITHGDTLLLPLATGVWDLQGQQVPDAVCVEGSAVKG